MDFHFNTPAKKLIKQDGRITGLIAEDEAGNSIEVEAKAVVIGTGGFMGNPKLIRENTTYENNGNIFFSRQRPNICGDGMQMAWDVGAAKGEMMVDAYKGMPIYCGPAGTKEGWEILSDPNLLVNLRGERFMNEAYPDRYYMANAIHRQPGGTAFMITSSNIAELYHTGELKLDSPPGMPAPELDLDKIVQAAQDMDYPYVYAADSLEELCEKTGIRLDGLTAAVDGYNRMCDAGRDHVFFKQSHLHVYKHFVRSGIGLRQFCDIGLWARAYHDEIDWQRLYDQCASVHAATFAAAAFRIARDYLGIKFDLPAPWDASLGVEPLLHATLCGSVYGSNDYTRLHSSTVTLNAVKANRTGEKSSVLSTVFPKREYLERRYPYLKKRPYMLPIAWVQRIAHYASEKQSGADNSASGSIKLAKERIELMRRYDVME